jgi:hypothetical protein
MQPLVSAVGESAHGLKGALAGKIVPVFVAASLVKEGAWPGPHSILPAGDVALVWAIYRRGRPFEYVNDGWRREWEEQGIYWKARALENLRRVSPHPLATGALLRDEGEPWLISLFDPDGLAPSRVLLRDDLTRLFPAGYRVALPESQRAFAFARDLDPEDADTVESLVRRSYAASQRPLSNKILDPLDLQPEDWPLSGAR